MKNRTGNKKIKKRVKGKMRKRLGGYLQKEVDNGIYSWVVEKLGDPEDKPLTIRLKDGMIAILDAYLWSMVCEKD